MHTLVWPDDKMVREVVYFAPGQGFQICEGLNYSLLELVQYDRYHRTLEALGSVVVS